MYTFVFTMELKAGEPITPDETTDLIEIIVDVLDQYGAEPDVSSTSTGDGLQLDVTICVDAPNALQAQRVGLAQMLNALERTDVRVHDFPLESVVRTSSGKVLTSA